MEHTFRLKPSGFEQVQKKLLYRHLFIQLFSVAVITTALFSQGSFEPLTGGLVLAVLVIIIVRAVGRYRKQLSSAKAQYQSLLFTIGNNLLTLSIDSTTALSLYFREVKAITKDEKGIYTIQGPEANDIIRLGPDLEDYEKLDAHLNAIQPVHFRKSVRGSQKQHVIGFFGVLVVLYSLLYYSPNVGVTIAVDVALTALLAVGLRYSLKSTTVPSHKRMMALVFFWFFLILGGLTCMRLITFGVMPQKLF